MKSVVGLFRSWQASRNKTAVEQPVMDMSPIEVPLEKMTSDELNYSISRFVVEVRKENGDPYPGETLRGMIHMLQLHLESTCGKVYRFLSEDFLQIRNTLDTMMKKLKQRGVGADVKQAEVITLDEEEMLWNEGILGSETPTKLLRTLFYAMGLNFALRAGQEHRNLRFGVENHSQLRLLVDASGKHFLRYKEQVSKTHQGGLNDRNKKPKVVDAYENEENKARCIVELFRKYVSHCPSKNRPAALYLRPLTKPTTHVWYACQPVGHHKLTSMVADICKEGGLGGHRTNHSLRATAATRLYSANVDEQLISEVTGHSSSAVRNYKRTGESQKRAIAAIVQGQQVAVEPKKAKEVSPSSSVSVASSGAPGPSGFNITVNVNLGDKKLM